ncbi:hypothetical protein ACKI1Q_38950 [Streptomyces galilaeus]|uniref:hypothetical protein n=1 Tax=Streptomyces galilaeus TaxID=33899 RepID=UPI0038F70F88
MTAFAAGDERCNAGSVRVGIELERVLARLEESGGAENVILDGGAALDALGALAIVDPKRVGCGLECVSGAAVG